MERVATTLYDNCMRDPAPPKRMYADAPSLAPIGPIETASLTSRASLPLEIEIGPGRGAFILERAIESPDVAIVGLEVRAKWAKIVDDRLKRLGYDDHARVYAADARSVLPRLYPDASVTTFVIHFPDPWWKVKQQKRRVITPAFVREMVRLLMPGGTVFVQTDVLERGELFDAVLSSMEGLQPDGDNVGSPLLAQSPWQAKSNRERRVMEAGLAPTRLRFRKP